MEKLKNLGYHITKNYYKEKRWGLDLKNENTSNQFRKFITKISSF